jgi:hypothetical protein
MLDWDALELLHVAASFLEVEEDDWFEIEKNVWSSRHIHIRMRESHGKFNSSSTREAYVGQGMRTQQT